MSIFFPGIAALRSAPASPDEVLVALTGGDRVVLSGSGRLPRAAEWPLEGERLEVGRLDDALCCLVDASGAIPEAFREVEVRSAFTILSEEEQTAVCRARSLAFWRRDRRYCGVCGHELADLATECARKCSSCGTIYYPQVTPAVITAVTDAEGRLLLAHNAKFREGMYSLIAGFVEPGETMESAVRREIREEVGIEVTRIRYFGSQSWPFPNGLMIGFRAEYAGGTVTPDGVEITDAKFFTINDMPAIPSPGSISRTLIEDWVRNGSHPKGNDPNE